MGARYRYPIDSKGTTTDQNGRILSSVTVSVFLAGTNTPATIYATLGSTTKINSVVSSERDGSFEFYVDESDYSSGQRFDILFSKSLFMDKRSTNIGIFWSGELPVNLAYTNVMNEFTEDQLIKRDNAGLRLYDTGTNGKEYALRSEGGNLDICRNDGDDLNPIWHVIGTLNNIAYTNIMNVFTVEQQISCAGAGLRLNDISENGKEFKINSYNNDLVVWRNEGTTDTPSWKIFKQFIATAYGVQNGEYVFSKDTGTVNSYVISPNPLPIDLRVGAELRFTASTTNTGPSTLTAGPVTYQITKHYDKQLEAGDIVAGQVVVVVLGDNFYSWQMVSLAGTEVGDSYQVMATQTDPTPGFLDAKVDGTTIKVVDDKLYVPLSDTYTVKSSITDPTPGFLDAKVDNDTVVVIDNKLVATATSDTYEVKASSTDVTPGFLEDKVDDVTIGVSSENKIYVKGFEDLQWYIPKIIGKVTYVNDYTFSVNGDQTSLFQEDQRIIAYFSSSPRIFGSIDSFVYVDEPLNRVTLVSCIWEDGFLDDTITSIKLGIITPYDGAIPTKRIQWHGESYTVSTSDANSTHVLDIYEPGGTFNLIDALDFPSGSSIEVVNEGDTAIEVIGTQSSSCDYTLLPGDSITIKAFIEEWVIFSGGSDYSVKASDTDQVPGFLDAKVDNDTIKVIDNKLVADQKLEQWYEPKVIGPFSVINGNTFSIQGNQSILFEKDQRIIITFLTNKNVFGTIDYISFVLPPKNITFITCVFEDGFLDDTITSIKLGIITPYDGAIPTKRIQWHGESYTVSTSDANSTHVLDIYEPGGTFTLLDASNFPSGSYIEIINKGYAPVSVLSTQDIHFNFIIAANSSATMKAFMEEWVASYSQSYAVMASWLDNSPGYLEDKVDHVTIDVVNDKLVAIGSGSYEVMASDTDTNPGYLDEKVDGITIMVSNNKLVAPSAGDTFKVMSSSSDTTPGYLDAKVDGTTVIVVDNKLMAPGGGEDTFTVKASFLDPTPGFLDAKVDGTTITVVENKLVATGGSGDTYEVKASSTDYAPGFLDSKVDNDTIKVNPLHNTMFATAVSDTYKVKFDVPDTEGYLKEKIDGTTISYNNNNKLVSGGYIKIDINDTPGFISDKIDNESIIINNNKITSSSSSKVKSTATDPTPGYLDAKVDNSTIGVKNNALSVVADYTTAVDIQNGIPIFGTDSGEDGITYIISLDPAPSSLTPGMGIRFFAATTNVGDAFLKIENTPEGALKLYKDGFHSLAIEDIIAGQTVEAVFTGDFWQITSTTSYIGSDDSAYHKNKINEISTTPRKDSIDATDVFLIEDSKSTPGQYAKKSVFSFNVKIPNADTKAFHSNVSGEIKAISQKEAPVSKDIVLIEDSENTYSKKYATVDSLISATGYATIESVQKDSYTYAADVGATPGEYKINLVPPITEYTDGLVVTFAARSEGVNNPPTISVNGLPNIPIYYQNGTRVSPDYIKSGQIVTALYKSTGGTSGTFIILNVPYDTPVSITDIQKSSLVYAQDTGTDGKKYIVNLDPPISAYNNGQMVMFKANTPNSITNPTISVNGLSSVPLLRDNGTTLFIGEIVKDQIVTAVFDVTQFKMTARDTFRVMANVADQNPGYLDAKVDGTTIIVDPATKKMSAPGGGGDTYKVKASDTDPTPGFLNSKVSNALIVNNNKLAVNVDNITVKIDPTNNWLIAPGGGGDTFMVKASATDPTPGFLDAKAGDAIKVANNKLSVKTDGTTIVVADDKLSANVDFLQQNRYTYCTATNESTANVLLCFFDPPLIKIERGTTLKIKSHLSNTGPVYIDISSVRDAGNPNSYSQITVPGYEVYADGTPSKSLLEGDIRAGDMITVTWDGNFWLLQTATARTALPTIGRILPSPWGGSVSVYRDTQYGNFYFDTAYNLMNFYPIKVVDGSAFCNFEWSFDHNLIELNFNKENFTSWFGGGPFTWLDSLALDEIGVVSHATAADVLLFCGGPVSPLNNCPVLMAAHAVKILDIKRMQAVLAWDLNELEQYVRDLFEAADARFADDERAIKDLEKNSIQALMPYGIGPWVVTSENSNIINCWSLVVFQASKDYLQIVQKQEPNDKDIQFALGNLISGKDSGPSSNGLPFAIIEDNGDLNAKIMIHSIEKNGEDVRVTGGNANPYSLHLKAKPFMMLQDMERSTVSTFLREDETKFVLRLNTQMVRTPQGTAEASWDEMISPFWKEDTTDNPSRRILVRKPLISNWTPPYGQWTKVPVAIVCPEDPGFDLFTNFISLRTEDTEKYSAVSMLGNVSTATWVIRRIRTPKTIMLKKQSTGSMILSKEKYEYLQDMVLNLPSAKNIDNVIKQTGKIKLYGMKNQEDANILFPKVQGQGGKIRVPGKVIRSANINGTEDVVINIPDIYNWDHDKKIKGSSSPINCFYDIVGDFDIEGSPEWVFMNVGVDNGDGPPILNISYGTKERTNDTILISIDTNQIVDIGKQIDPVDMGGNAITDLPVMTPVSMLYDKKVLERLGAICQKMTQENLNNITRN